jgi:hypothetical protein
MTRSVLSNILYCLTSETPIRDTCHITYESLPNSDLRLLNSVLPAHSLFPSAAKGSCILLGQTLKHGQLVHLLFALLIAS